MKKKWKIRLGSVYFHMSMPCHAQPKCLNALTPSNLLCSKRKKYMPRDKNMMLNPIAARRGFPNICVATLPSRPSRPVQAFPSIPTPGIIIISHVLFRISFPHPQKTKHHHHHHHPFTEPPPREHFLFWPPSSQKLAGAALLVVGQAARNPKSPPVRMRN